MNAYVILDTMGRCVKRGSSYVLMILVMETTLTCAMTTKDALFIPARVKTGLQAPIVRQISITVQV
jgi:hypothetical protein